MLSGCLASANKANVKRAESLQNLHAIQLAIERYYFDSKTYPADLSVLQSEAYLPRLPGNPYNGAPMEQIPAGQHQPGCFSYLTDGKSYALVLYGPKGSRSFASKHALPGGAEATIDWDYVVIVLESQVQPN